MSRLAALVTEVLLPAQLPVLVVQLVEADFLGLVGCWLYDVGSGNVGPLGVVYSGRA
jgi:hypothetical protein